MSGATVWRGDEAYLRLETVAELYRVRVVWLREVADRGLLGPLEAGSQVFSRLLALAPGATADHGPRTYLSCQSEFQDPAGRTPSFRWRHGFVGEGGVGAWAQAVVEGLRGRPGLELRYPVVPLSGG